MNILVLATDYPPSTRQPGSPRLYNICKELARNHRLVLCVLEPTAERREAFRIENDASRVFSATRELPSFAPRRTPRLPWYYRNLLHRLLFMPNFSRSILAPEYVAQIRETVAASCAEIGADVLYVDGVGCFQYVPERLRQPVMIDLCDCISWLISQLAAREKSLRRRLPLRLASRSVREVERVALASTALPFTISPVDAQSFREICASVDPLVVQNGVDQDYFAFQTPPEGSRTLIFTGVMGYEPNADAARYCAEEIFPLVRKRHPDARLLVVGADPSEVVRKLAEREGVVVTGAVPDVRPYMRESALFVCPLRIGAGVKNKVLAAMSMGLPVVANSLSMSGIASAADENVLMAETPAQFAAQICTLFEDRALAARISAGGRRLVESKYAWGSQVAVLEQALARVSAERPRSAA